MSKLTHLDTKGHASMVDVSDKAVTKRMAVAKGRINMRSETLAMITEGSAPKGDVLATARIAGIMAAKKTAELIPLCHPLMLSKVSVELSPNVKDSCVEIEASVTVKGETGVEMEALTAATTAALTLYDMLKAVDRGMHISDMRITHKSGGKSGTYEQE